MTVTEGSPARGAARAQNREQILRDWYQDHYSQVAASANGSFMQRYVHSQMERAFPAGRACRTILELGGNTGEHVPFVQQGYDRYVVSDLYPPQLPAELTASGKVIACQCDAAAIPFADESFDRVIATCLLHHVDSPLQVAAEMRRVLRPDGFATLMIPTDPGFGYRAGVAVTSARNARQAGVAQEMRLVKALDHRNHYRSIARQVEHVFGADDIQVKYLPGRLPSVELNMFTVWQIRRI